MNDFILSLACFLATLALYFANKKLYRRRRTLLLMPLVLTPMILVLLLVVTHISYQDYIGETHWLLWLLGPATIAFAVPVYENLHIIRRHWLSLTAGVTTAVLVAVYSSVWLARLLTLPEEVQRSLAVRSITTPFALEAAKQMGGQPDLVALFVVITGVFGMAVGDILFLRLAVRSRLAKGAGFGASSHGRQFGLRQIGVHEGFVGAARRFQQTHRRLVDLFESAVFLHVGAAHQRDFAVGIQLVSEEHLFLPLQRDGDAAHRDVALAGGEVRRQGFPAGFHPLHVGAQALGQRLRHVDVDAFIAAVFLEEGIGLVVAGGADLQGLLLQHFVQVGLRAGAAGGEQQREGE